MTVRPNVENVHTNPEFKREVKRFAKELWKTALECELAWVSASDGTGSRAIDCETLSVPEISVSRVKGMTGCRGKADRYGTEIKLVFGQAETWGEVAELITHEICHCLRPWTEEDAHGKYFWALLCDAMRRAFEIRMVTPVKPGDKRYSCDARLVEALSEKQEWARVKIPRMGDVSDVLLANARRVFRQVAGDWQPKISKEEIARIKSLILIPGQEVLVKAECYRIKLPVPRL